jgi:hypothetical protein
MLLNDRGLNLEVFLNLFTAIITFTPTCLLASEVAAIDLKNLTNTHPIFTPVLDAGIANNHDQPSNLSPDSIAQSSESREFPQPDRGQDTQTPENPEATSLESSQPEVVENLEPKPIESNQPEIVENSETKPIESNQPEIVENSETKPIESNQSETVPIEPSPSHPANEIDRSESEPENESETSETIDPRYKIPPRVVPKERVPTQYRSV